MAAGTQEVREYEPNYRWNKIYAETNPLSRYFKPPKKPGYMRDPISEANEARIEELMRKNTYGNNLTEPEIQELRRLADRPGLNTFVRYPWSAANYTARRAKYKTNLKKYKNSRSFRGSNYTNANMNRLRALHTNYKNLFTAEQKFNYPHQLEQPEPIPGENYVGINPEEFLKIAVQGGRKKTRKVKKNRKGTRCGRRS